MSIRVTTNVKQVIRELEEGNQNIIDGAKTGLLQGMRFFESHIIRTQMSGRLNPNWGLKTQTGNLKRSWFTYVKKMYADFTVATATSAKYARIHEYGGIIRPKGGGYLTFKIGGHFVKVGSVAIPKRLHIREAFKKRGDDFINEGMVKSLSRFVRIR